MRLVLTYRGLLPSSGDNGDKHRIRQALHPQLRRLWTIEEPLRLLASTSLDKIADTFSRGPFRFVPLATKSLHLVCQLDITFLRREEPGHLVRHGGDIDNRLKVLFDSLRVPNFEQVTKLAPSVDENPLYCLLEDDAMITGFRVTSERLLEPAQLLPAPVTTSDTTNESHVNLLITAVIRPTKITMDSMNYLGGWL